MPITRRLALAGLAALATTPAPAAPRARLLSEAWRQTGSAPGPDHGAWDAFLARHLTPGADGINRLAYGAAKPDLPSLRAYIAALEAADPTGMAPDAAMAFWINLYNALTVALVIEAYPVSSIREVRGGLLNTGPWTDEVASVNGTALSLDDIEHGILRPVWREPRIHYAVNCAALGCPNLAARAFTADRLEAMLAEGARAFVNHPRGARIEGGDLIVSSIYDWFEEDFGGSETGVLAHLREHAEPPLRAALEGRTGIDGDDYDWSLNDAATA